MKKQMLLWMVVMHAGILFSADGTSRSSAFSLSRVLTGVGAVVLHCLAGASARAQSRSSENMWDIDEVRLALARDESLDWGSDRDGTDTCTSIDYEPEHPWRGREQKVTIFPNPMIPSVVTVNAVSCQESGRTQMIVCHTALKDASRILPEIDVAAQKQNTTLPCQTEKSQVMVVWLPRGYEGVLKPDSVVHGYTCDRIEELSVFIEGESIAWSGPSRECKKVSLPPITQPKKQREKRKLK